MSSYWVPKDQFGSNTQCKLFLFLSNYAFCFKILSFLFKNEILSYMEAIINHNTPKSASFYPCPLMTNFAHYKVNEMTAILGLSWPPPPFARHIIYECSLSENCPPPPWARHVIYQCSLSQNLTHWDLSWVVRSCI